MRTPIVLLSLLLCATGAVADIYKEVDAQGNVRYTDVPSSPKAEKIEKPTGSTYAPPRLPARSEGSEDEGRPKVTAPFQYESVTITAPANDGVLTGTGGKVDVQLAVVPGLGGSDQVVITLDGATIYTGTGSAYTAEGVDRGTHTLGASVVDKAGTALITAAPVTFHLRQHSALHPRN